MTLIVVPKNTKIHIFIRSPDARVEQETAEGFDSPEEKQAIEWVSKGRKVLAGDSSILGISFWFFNGKDEKCRVRVVWLNVYVEIWPKHEDCLYGCQRQRRLWRVSFISSCSSPLQNRSEGSYPKKSLIVRRTLVDDFGCRQLHFTCPELCDTNHSQCQPNSARPRKQRVARHGSSLVGGRQLL